LSFSLQMDQAGLYSVQVRYGQQRAVLPTALSVVTPLAIESVISAHAQGQMVSDAGGTPVTIQVQGLSEGLSLHWFPAGQGILPSASNKVAFTLNDSSISFVTPRSQPGWQYQVALLREASAERVDSVAGQWLTAIDDTAPAVRLVSALGALQSLVLEADEPLSAQGFSVVKVFKDYDTHAQPSEDISSRFNPIVSQGNRLELRLRSDAVLEANALYQVTLTGVRDVANNPARDNGVTLAGTYSGSYQA